MFFSWSLDRTRLLYTNHADNTDLHFASTIKKAENIRTFRDLRVQMILTYDFEKPLRLTGFCLDVPIHHQYHEFGLEPTYMTLDPEQLRHAMRAWTTGVAVVTAAHEDKQYGMTVNSFTSISLEPPLISVVLKRLTHTHELVEASGEFAVSILSAYQKELSERFAGKQLVVKDRFDGVPTETLAIHAPLIKGGMAYFNCRVTNSMPVGENTLFVAEVIAAGGEGEGNPLVYHNRTYWNLAPR